MKPITRHCQPFEPTHPNPQTEDEKRLWVAEARAYWRTGYFKHESAPLPELYPGQYEDCWGLR